MTRVVDFRYRDYIASEGWRKKRQQRLDLDGRMCTNCDATTRLEVHHLTYERLGNERMEDLVTMCRECHARHHGLNPGALRVAGGKTKAEAVLEFERARLEHFQAVLAVAHRLYQALVDLEDLACSSPLIYDNAHQNREAIERVRDEIRAVLRDQSLQDDVSLPDDVYFRVLADRSSAAGMGSRRDRMAAERRIAERRAA